MTRTRLDKPAPVVPTRRSFDATHRQERDPRNLSSGRPLDGSVRGVMERRFGHDFSKVRVHADENAAASAQSVGAAAYTLGRDVVFNRGRYDPSGQSGRWLLAHELAHVAQQGSAERPAARQLHAPVGVSPEAEAEAHRAADAVAYGGTPVVTVRPAVGAAIARVKLGIAVTHPAGSRSPYRVMTATYDGREFVVFGNGTEIMRVAAQSGRPVPVRPADLRACGGSAGETYRDNPRYVGIRDYGPIPEGEYQFSATQMATFSEAERYQMIAGGSFTDPFGASLHGGDWGAGRVALRPVRVDAGPPGCGNTRTRSGFFLHGGILPGSSGCIDVGNAGFTDLVRHMQGYRGRLVVTVRYRHPAPAVGAVERALGRFTYPTPSAPGRDPSMMDRFRSLFGGD